MIRPGFVAIANLLTNDEMSKLGEVFWTDIDALVKQRNQCWQIAWGCFDNYPLSFASWLDHCRTIQTAIDAWEGGQL